MFYAGSPQCHKLFSSCVSWFLCNINNVHFAFALFCFYQDRNREVGEEVTIYSCYNISDNVK